MKPEEGEFDFDLVDPVDNKSLIEEHYLIAKGLHLDSEGKPVVYAVDVLRFCLNRGKVKETLESRRNEWCMNVKKDGDIPCANAVLCCGRCDIFFELKEDLLDNQLTRKEEI